jgi:hypothetical protein
MVPELLITGNFGWTIRTGADKKSDSGLHQNSVGQFMKFYSFRQWLAIRLGKSGFRIRMWLYRLETFLRVKLGRNEFYCPGCLKQTLWWDFQYGDGPKGRCLEGCTGEWFRVLTANEAAIAKNNGYTKVDTLDQVIPKLSREDA